ncbi:MAG: hypothetical protein JWO53_457 [Chlamydiia bacterium]|nr:hypothetical protein [Chlamydiia bacterium]
MTENLVPAEPQDTHQEIAQKKRPVKQPKGVLADEAATPSNIKGLQAAIQSYPDLEKKLDHVVQFMESALAQVGSPHFKDFWEAKKLCQELFKGNVNPSHRVLLWTKYSELSREARRLKEIFDEQSTFACEQIEIAVKAVEDEMGRFEELLKHVRPFEFSVKPRSLESHQDQYRRLQTELSLYNLFATKVNGLRKELIKTEMRIRDKNKFFLRLSRLGDTLFPKRKELIHELGQLFIQDVDTFIKNTFDHEMKSAGLFHAREEIKSLQSAAKELTLNTDIFSKGRKRLSECWDSIKHLVEEHKKVEGELRAEHKQHRDLLLTELQDLKKKYEEKVLSEKEAQEQLNDFIARMRSTTLGKQEIHILREEANHLREILFKKEFERQKSALTAQQEKESERIAAQEAIKKKITDFLAQGDAVELDLLASSHELLKREVTTSAFTRSEKIALERMLESLSDLILEKRKQKLLSMLSTDREKLTLLKNLLSERKKQSQEIKRGLEARRKAKGTSGLDFAEALQVNDIITEEKERLEKIEAEIEELENEIIDLES